MRPQRLYNPLVTGLLRSPLHGLISRWVMLISVTGRRSGKTFTMPVSYVRDEDGTLLVVSPAERLWWRNLRGGAPVAVLLRGRRILGAGEACTGDGAVEEGGLLSVLRRSTALRRRLRVELDDGGRPVDPKTLQRAARSLALIRVSGLAPAPAETRG